MADRQHWKTDAWIGAGYFALATIAILCTRFDHGVAFLWPPSAFLIGILIARPRRNWAPPVNDEHGHDIGDWVLQRFAVIAQKSLRGGDLLARVGGEEFAIFFPGLDRDGAARVCERIRASIAAAQFPATAGPLRITVSGGVASLGSDGMEAALKRADTALYAAKSAGRDRMALAA